jgi:hypothetical protein
MVGQFHDLGESLAKCMHWGITAMSEVHYYLNGTEYSLATIQSYIAINYPTHERNYTANDCDDCPEGAGQTRHEAIVWSHQYGPTSKECCYGGPTNNRYFECQEKAIAEALPNYVPGSYKVLVYNWKQFGLSGTFYNSCHGSFTIINTAYWWTDKIEYYTYD